MARSWSREQRPDLAADRILDAADQAFAQLGVSGAGMARIAEFAGCSRGTLYRYFPTRHDLHLAYVERVALAIVERVRLGLVGVEGRQARIVEAILLSVAAVRTNPATTAWFEPGASGVAARMSRSSEVIDSLTTRFVSELLDSGDRESLLRARFLVRIVVSLLASPGESDAEERALVERFVAPALAQAPPRPDAASCTNRPDGL